VVCPLEFTGHTDPKQLECCIQVYCFTKFYIHHARRLVRVVYALCLLAVYIIMAVLWSRACHYIFALWFLLSSSFFLAYSQPSHIGCLPYFHIWCGLSANLECRSEMCCTRLAENTGCKKIAKNSPSAHHRTTLSGCIFSTKA